MEDQNKTKGVPVANVTNTPSVTPTLKGTEYEKNTCPPEDLDDMWLRWKCLKCGFVYEGTKPLNVCPKCGNDNPDYFQDAD